MSKLDYAGDINPLESWELLSKSKDICLIDCRTQAEWQFVGIPNLDSIGKRPILVEWQTYPSMSLNQNFENQVKESGVNKTDTIILLCRSGGRSKSAAEFLTSQGFESCYNCTGGFEGEHDLDEHRSGKSGWKFLKLPWKQG